MSCNVEEVTGQVKNKSRMYRTEKFTEKQTEAVRAKLLLEYNYCESTIIARNNCFCGKRNAHHGNRTRDLQITWSNVGGKGGIVTQSPHQALQLVATNLQGLGAATILLLVTSSRLTCSVYIQRSNRPSAWLTCTRNGARLCFRKLIGAFLSLCSCSLRIGHSMNDLLSNVYIESRFENCQRIQNLKPIPKDV